MIDYYLTSGDTFHDILNLINASNVITAIQTKSNDLNNDIARRKDSATS